MKNEASRRAVLLLAGASVAPVAGCSHPLESERTGTATEFTSSFSVENQMDTPVEVELSLEELTEDGETESEPTVQAYTIEPDQAVSLEDRLEPNTAYRVRFDIDAGVSKTWDLYPYEGLVVEIYSPTSVETTRSEV